MKLSYYPRPFNTNGGDPEIIATGIIQISVLDPDRPVIKKQVIEHAGTRRQCVKDIDIENYVCRKGDTVNIISESAYQYKEGSFFTIIVPRLISGIMKNAAFTIDSNSITELIDLKNVEFSLDDEDSFSLLD
jgi:hypothetical protein